MATTQVLIVPSYRGRGMIGLCIALGCIGGLFAIGAESLPSDLSLLLAGLDMLAAPFAFATFIVRVTQRVSRTLVLNAAFWVGLGLTVLLRMLQSSMSADTDHSVVQWLEAIPVFVIGLAVMGAAFGMLARWFTRVAMFKTVEQDGDRCWKCAGVKREGSECPHCGEAPAQGQAADARLQRSLRVGRRLGWPLVAMFAIGGAAWAVTRPALPAANPASYQRLASLGPLIGTDMRPPGSSAAALGSPRTAAQLPLDPANSLFLLVVYNEHPDPNNPAMQLQVAHVPQPIKGVFGTMTTQVTLGAPRVLCDLDQQQAEEVFLHGVPQSLQDAMLAAASSTSWNGSSWPVPDVRLDPTSDFPKSPHP